MVDLTREGITALLEKSDKAVCRALVVLYNNQTADEQESSMTHEHNGKGFSPFDAEIGTSMAKFYIRNGYLSPRQVAVWRKINNRGSMKIANYWRQLLDAAKQKQVALTSFPFGVNEQ